MIWKYFLELAFARSEKHFYAVPSYVINQDESEIHTSDRKNLPECMRGEYKTSLILG